MATVSKGEFLISAAWIVIGSVVSAESFRLGIGGIQKPGPGMPFLLGILLIVISVRLGAMAILLPSTFAVPLVTGIIILAGIYYGAMYGGSTTSIPVNIPGEAGLFATCLDGYQMARQGHAGAALGISAVGSFIGGSARWGLAYPLAELALKFGPAEYFALMMLGLTLV